jgi:class 3 adenylate cyclase/tetratricopeptide (TPR) repeat protein
MECPSCRTQQSADARFCVECGALLPSFCALCGCSNPPDAKFCGNCGSRIARSRERPDRLGAASAIHPKRTDASAERRLLTVMFCDLVGSTLLASQLDPEDFRDVIGAYHRCVTDVITRFNGFVARYLGDGELIYFGYPEAHEDDAERAVRAGLATVEAVTRLPLLEGYEPQVRIGIATGLVVVGDIVMTGAGPEQDVAGETPSLAARLQAMAEPNGIVIADGTRKMIGGLFECESLGTTAIKGFAKPVQAWRVLRSSTIQSRFQAFHPTDLTPLVGRETEIEVLLRQWERAKSGQGRVVLLSGEPGIGKSRLVCALQEQIGSEHHVLLQYSCSRHHMDSALHPVISQLERAAQIQAEDTPEEKFEKLKVLLGPGTDPVDIAVLAAQLSIAPAAHGTLSHSPEQKRARTFDALLDHLERLARQDPVLLVYEDVHWIDPSTHELIDLTIRRLRHLPVLMLITSRTEFELPRIDQPDLVALPLGGLDRHEGTALVDRISHHTLPAEVVAAIVDRTDGVPLFLEELTAAVLEAGMGADAAEGRGSAALTSTQLLPATLHASLTARLDRLSPLAKQVAQIAAVIGREFSHELVSAMAPQSDDALQEALDQLVSSGLIHLHERAPQVTYLFKHALVQDAAYGGMLRRVRRALHARVAKALEESCEHAATADPAVLAHHYAHAGMVDKAVDCYLAAGRQAITRSAMAEAAAQARKGLELLHHLPEGPTRRKQELELQLALGRSLIAIEDEAAPATGAAFARAGELCEAEDGVARQLEVLQGQFAFRFGRGELLAASALAEQCLALGKRWDDRAARVTGHLFLGICGLFLGRLVVGRTHLEQAIALLDASKVSEPPVRVDRVHVMCRSYLSAALLLLGYPVQALSCSRQALTDAEALATPDDLASVLAIEAGNYRDVRDPVVARERADALIALAAEHGFPHWLAEGLGFRGWTLAEEGAFEEAIEHTGRGISILRTGESGVGMLYWLLTSAEVYGKAGRLREGLALLDEALEMVQTNKVGWYEAEVHRLRGSLLRRTEEADPSLIEDCFQKAIAVAQEQEAKWWELRAVSGLAAIWRDQGRGREAHDRLARVYGWFTEGFDIPDLVEARLLLDRLKGNGAN